jgi:ATP-dependent 26S proteasome regulatory subunit
MNNFGEDFADYCCSGHALLHVDTFEKDRAISEIAKVAKKIDRKVYIWSIAQGWIDENGNKVCEVVPAAPVEDHIQAIVDFPEKTICILRDCGEYFQHVTYPRYDVVIGWLDELRKIVASVQQTIVMVGPNFDIPKSLSHDITQMDFALPNNEQINERIDFVCSEVTKSDGTKFEPSKTIIPKIVDACRGMTSQQIVDRVALALRKHKDLNGDAIKTIIREKAGVIRASGLLTYIEPPSGGLSLVGGYDAIKQHVLLDRPCFSKEARDFGIEFPRGLMLVGLQGCGKTLLSSAIASELGLPIIAMDVGNLMNKFVGESERNMREAIKMIESVSPCELVLDEIEKGFGGSGDFDGGASRRLFGSFIKWLNDRQSSVYIIATANQIQSLPPELSRKGRFDEIYGLDLPAEKERIEIFTIHLIKRNRDPNDFDINMLAKSTDGFTGADIEQVVKLGLKMAFSKKEQLKTYHLKQAVPEIIPLSKTEASRVANIRQWCANHAKPANPPPKTAPPKIGERKISLN